jgi:inner membrane protein
MHAAAVPGPARRIAFVLLPVAALAVVATVDTLPDPPTLFVLGLLDESAHLATAWIFLAAFLPARARPIWLWALVGAVAIDVDHVPLYLWDALTAGSGSRPVTHSLTTVVVLAIAGAVASPRLRPPLLGLALGVVLHLVRDLAKGPGVPLDWPLSNADVRVPYAAYLIVLTVVAAAAVARRWFTAPVPAGVHRAGDRDARGVP